MGILLREKQTLQQLHSKKGVSLFLRVSLFSGDYGIEVQVQSSKFKFKFKVGSSRFNDGLQKCSDLKFNKVHSTEPIYETAGTLLFLLLSYFQGPFVKCAYSLNQLFLILDLEVLKN